MSVEVKAWSIFKFFANGGDRLTVSALIALHRATEDSGESDTNLRMMFTEMFEEAYPVDFDPELGLTEKGLVHCYTSGMGGDVHKDYAAIKESGFLEKYRKAEFIFQYFASGSDWISFKAMSALHRATEDSDMSDSELIDAFMEMLPENCAPEEFDRAIGLRKSAFLRSYTEGWGGSVESDFDAINVRRGTAALACTPTSARRPRLRCCAALRFICHFTAPLPVAPPLHCCAASFRCSITALLCRRRIGSTSLSKRSAAPAHTPY